MIAVDLRGRGESGFDPNPANYAPHVYAGDLLKLLDQLGIADAVFVGTSLGGIITMVMAVHDSDRMAGVLLNDIGPELDRRGLDRIMSYVGQVAEYSDWDQLARDMAARNGDVLKRLDQAGWLAYAHRSAAMKDGVIRLDYDPAIAAPFAAANSGPPMSIWPMYEALEGRPVTILRGALSDLFSVATAERMASEIGDVELVTIADVGHVPTFDEPESLDAVERLLTRVLARG